MAKVEYDDLLTRKVLESLKKYLSGLLIVTADTHAIEAREAAKLLVDNALAVSESQRSDRSGLKEIVRNLRLLSIYFGPNGKYYKRMDDRMRLDNFATHIEGTLLK